MLRGGFANIEFMQPATDKGRCGKVFYQLTKVVLPTAVRPDLVHRFGTSIEIREQANEPRAA